MIMLTGNALPSDALIEHIEDNVTIVDRHIVNHKASPVAITPADGESKSEWNSPIMNVENGDIVSGVVGVDEDELWNSMDFSDAEELFRNQIKVDGNYFIPINGKFHEVIWYG